MKKLLLGSKNKNSIPDKTAAEYGPPDRPSNFLSTQSVIIQPRCWVKTEPFLSVLQDLE